MKWVCLQGRIGLESICEEMEADYVTEPSRQNWILPRDDFTDSCPCFKVGGGDKKFHKKQVSHVELLRLERASGQARTEDGAEFPTLNPF